MQRCHAIALVFPASTVTTESQNSCPEDRKEKGHEIFFTATSISIYHKKKNTIIESEQHYLALDKCHHSTEKKLLYFCNYKNM